MRFVPYWIRAHPAIATIAVMAGCVITPGFWWYVRLTAPTIPTLISINAIGDHDRDKILVAHYRSAPIGPCVRQGTYILYRDKADGIRDYIPVGLALNGATFKQSIYDFDLWMQVSSMIPSGEWNYIVRFYHSCPPFGLVHWLYTGEPVKVTIP